MSRNIDRQMRKVCDTFGEQAVMAWCQNNLGDSGYPASRRLQSADPTPNRVMSDHSSGRVLLDIEHPEREDDAPPPEPVAPPARPAPKYSPGMFSLF